MHISGSYITNFWIHRVPWPALGTKIKCRIQECCSSLVSLAGQRCYRHQPRGHQEPAAIILSNISAAAPSEPRHRPRQRCYHHFLSLPSGESSLKQHSLRKRELQQCWAFPRPSMQPPQLKTFQGFAERCHVENQIHSPEICWLNKRDGWNKLPDRERVLPIVGRKRDFTLFLLASFKNSARN